MNPADGTTARTVERPEFDWACCPRLEARELTLGRRLDAIGWGLLFVLIGAIAMPGGIAQNALVIGVGVAFLGLNAIRAWQGVRIRWLSVVLGTTAIVAGAGALAGLHVEDIAFFFVLLGIVSMVRALRLP